MAVKDTTPDAPTDRLAGMSVAQFAQLGLGEIAYVRAAVVGQQKLFILSAANGERLLVAETQESAIANAVAHKLYPLTCH